MTKEIKITFENIDEAMRRFQVCKEMLDSCMKADMSFEESSGNAVNILKQLSSVMSDCIKEIGNFLEQMRMDLQYASKVFKETDQEIGNKMKQLP